MSGAGAAVDRSTLRQSFEVMLGEVLRDTAATGYTLGPITYSDAIEIALHKQDARFVVWLRPARDPGGAYKETAHFKIGYQDDPPDQSVFAVIDTARAGIQSWEESVPAEAIGSLFDRRAIASPNLEMLAVRAGLKPACRYLVSPTAADSVVQNMRDEGLYACVTDAAPFVSRFRWGFTPGETTIVHVGRTEKAAHTAAYLERSMISGWRRWLQGLAIERALGHALGYPPCCTDAFLKVRKETNDTIRFQAMSRTGERAAAVLNDVDETQSIISHLVCSYDCAPSLRYAAALLEELGRTNSDARDVRSAALQGMVIRFHNGGALRLLLETPPSGPRIRFATVDAFGTGPLVDQWHTLLRESDGLEVTRGTARFVRGEHEHARLPAPTHQVQIRIFA